MLPVTCSVELLRIRARTVLCVIRRFELRRSWLASPAAMPIASKRLSSKVDVRTEVLDLIYNKKPVTAWKDFAVAHQDHLGEAVEIIEELGEHLVNKSAVGNILKYLSKAGAQSGDLDVVDRTRRLLFVLGGRKVMAQHLEFKQYKAECLWFGLGEVRQACELIVELFRAYPNRRKDVSNVVGYFMRDAVATPPSSSSIARAKLDASKWVVDEARNIFSGRYNIPALNLWRPCFASKYFVHHVLAETVLHENPGALEIIHQRLPTILREALRIGDVDMLHRAVEFILRHGLKDYLSQTLGCLLYHYCMQENVKNAQEVVSTMLALDVRIPCEVMPFYFNLLSRKNVAVPQKVLEMKYAERMRARAQVPEPDFKWW